MKYGDKVTRKQNVHGHQEANEPEKLYYEAQ